jgi:hypothetical protein
MKNKNKIFLVKNFFGYEKVQSVPIDLPKDMISVYLTDNEETARTSKKLGWDYSVVDKNYTHITDYMERRILIGKINSYPKIFISDIMTNHSTNIVFVSDSNIVQLWNQYKNFVESCDDSKCLYVTSGYYASNSDRDNIESELYESLIQPRWSYNRDGMINCSNEYIKELESNGIDAKKVSVVSAKYIGWNTSHPKYKTISDKLYTEYIKNLQGNIILTYLSSIYSDSVNNYFCTDYTGGMCCGHNFHA